MFAQVRRFGLRFVLAIVLALCTILAHASPAMPSSTRSGPTVNATVRAGDRVMIRWDRLPARVEELELLLSVDGGESYPLRVSPELDGHETSYTWSVPNLAAAEARLRVRMRLDGREVESEPGPSFEIRVRTHQPHDLDLMNEGDWWTGPDGLPRNTPRDGLSHAGPRLESASHAHAALPSQRPSWLAPVLSAPSPVQSASGSHSNPARSRAEPPPRSTPHRE